MNEVQLLVGLFLVFIFFAKLEGPTIQEAELDRYCHHDLLYGICTHCVGDDYDSCPY